MLKLSVVMSVYNSEPFLNECIESILNQSFSDFEFIIINAESTDGSLEILKKYEKIDNRIRVIDTNKCTIAEAMNMGIKASSGKYIARMDSDDISRVDRFEKQIEFLDQNLHVGIVSSKAEIIGDQEEKNAQLYDYKLNLDIDENNSKEMLLTHWYCFCTPATMMRSEVFKIAGMYGNFICEDFELLMNALSKGIKIHKIDEYLIKYRLHESSSTILKNANGKGIRDSIIVKLHHIEQVNHIKNYLIWGTGGGGAVTNDVLKEKISKANCLGFIDSFKEGVFNGLNIYKPMQIKDLYADYIFIATEPGKKFALNFLTSLGLKNMDDFLCAI